MDHLPFADSAGVVMVMVIDVDLVEVFTFGVHSGRGQGSVAGQRPVALGVGRNTVVQAAGGGSVFLTLVISTGPAIKSVQARLPSQKSSRTGRIGG